MAEFAEESLEKLLPAFESIKASKLFTVDEFSAFVQQCSRFEYRLQKRTKSPMDYELYIAHLRDFLKKWRDLLVANKRKAPNDVARQKFKRKIAWLYKIRSERFKKAEYYLEEARFCRKSGLLESASNAYNTLIQIHAANADYYLESADFEFRKNENAQNALVVLSYGRRRFPEDKRFDELMKKVAGAEEEPPAES